MKKIIIGLSCLLLGAVVGYFVLKKDNLLIISPLGFQREQKQEKKNGMVLGFLPTWMVGKTKMYGKEIDQLVFLGVEVRADGSLVWDIQSKKLDNEEYLKLKKSIKDSGGKNILGIKLFEDKKIDSLIASAEAKKQMFNEVETIVKAGGFDGVNIDFEYMNNPVRVLDEDFVAFLDEIRQVDWGEISLDVFANTVIKGDGKRLKRMMESVDRMVVMAYDFHRPGGDYAGPVAPMGAEVGERSISEITEKVSEFGLDKEKVVMAYPLYGYEWETVDESFGSVTRDVGYGKTVFYSEAASDPPWGVSVEPRWDEMSLSPWAAWQEKAQRSRTVRKKVGKIYKNVKEYYTVDQWHQAYFENELSLGIKVQSAKQAQFGGVGFWALGYEGKESNLISDLRSMITN
jgi:spore germination protein YaaH